MRAAYGDIIIHPENDTEKEKKRTIENTPRMYWGAGRAAALIRLWSGGKLCETLPTCVLPRERQTVDGKLKTNGFRISAKLGLQGTVAASSSRVRTAGFTVRVEAYFVSTLAYSGW